MTTCFLLFKEDRYFSTAVGLAANILNALGYANNAKYATRSLQKRCAKGLSQILFLSSDAIDFDMNGRSKNSDYGFIRKEAVIKDCDKLPCFPKSVHGTVNVLQERENIRKRTAAPTQDKQQDYTQAITHKTKKTGSKLNCIRKLVALTADRCEAEADVLVGISALIQKLPARNMMAGTVKGETELWSGTYDPVLISVFSSPENDVFLRWSNVIPTEGSVDSISQVRPDALVCEIDQLNWGESIGFGEVKLAEATPNLDLLAKELLRLANLSKDALSNSNLEAVISFQIHGYTMKVYMQHCSWHHFNRNVGGLIIHTPPKCDKVGKLYN